MTSYVIGFAGQSNAARHFDPTFSTFNGQTSAEFYADELAGYLGEPTSDIALVPTGVGGSGASNLANPATFWWDLTNNTPGPLLQSAVTDILAQETTSGVATSAIVWAQGERDALAIANGDQTLADYTAATEAIFAYFRSELGDPDLPILIQQIGDISTDDRITEIGNIRRAQGEIAAADPNTYLAAVTYDEPKDDTLHFSASAYHDVAARLALATASILDDTTSLSLTLPEDGFGPQITGAALANGATEILVAINDGDAAALSAPGGAANIDGFVVKLDGIEVEATSTVLEAGNQVRLGFENALYGTVTVEYALEATGGTGGTSGYHTDNDTLFDSNGLPLEPGLFSATGSSVATLGTTRLEAENAQLNSGFVVANGALAAIASGTGGIQLPDGSPDGTTGNASFSFTGTTGIYGLELGFFDQSGGQSTIDVQVNGSSVGTVNLNRDVGGAEPNSQNHRSLVVDSATTLISGDTITLFATGDAPEDVVIDYLDLVLL
ncbi:MAG: sialate O-acetylesterase, partial [Pseudomonadota bacterium]